jgi:hypothetical protein
MLKSMLKLGEIVIYRPRNDDPAFHNKGHRPELPAVVVKVWDNVADLQVLPDLDLNVLQDSACAITFVAFVKHGQAHGTWRLRDDF